MIVTLRKIFKSYTKTVWKWKFSFILFFWIMVPAITVFEPVIFSKIIEQIELFLKTWEFNLKLTIYIIIFWALYIVVTLILQYFYDYNLVTKTNVSNFNDITDKYSKKILFMNFWEYLSKQQWKIFKIFDRWTREQYSFIHFVLSDLLKHISWITLIIILLFFINVKMALLTLSMIPVMTGLWLYFILKVSPEQRKLNDKWDSIFWIISNVLSSFALTKTLWIEKVFRKKIKKDLNSILNKQLQVDKSWSISSIYSWMIVMIARIIVLWFWVFFVTEWSLSFAELFLFFSYIWWIYFPLWYIFSRLRDITIQITAIEKMHSEFDLLKIDKTNTGIILKNVFWNIQFNDVNFNYTKDKNIFKKLSFTIKPWDKIAFVWNTWAGKSTIVNLLFRFWDIDSGEILLDWENINNLSKDSLRQNIWLVMQDNSLFNTSIKENLLFANPKASIKDIEKAIKNAEAHFVFDLKDWINTIIWERWLKLSWWEKQRLSIARLFLKNPKILVLDEATSALDNKTEKLVQKALDKLTKWRTSIVIAHRLSTIQNADKIFMLENWKIVEEGNYEELMNKKAKFYNLANPEHLILN